MKVEAEVGIEPTNGAFAEPCLTTWLLRRRGREYGGFPRTGASGLFTPAFATGSENRLSSSRTGRNLPRMRHHLMGLCLVALALFQPGGLPAADKAKAAASPFRWKNEFPKGFPREQFPTLLHRSYRSATNQADIGYCIYLPPGHDAAENAGRRYPVIYYLHGGRPGGEMKSVSLVAQLDRAMRSGAAPEMIYVFVNGGAMSHYDYPQLKSYGETAFVDELIPHIDATYRTVARREGRGLEGFSQGGRGTGRIMLKRPELFLSCAPMGGGHQHEKRISEEHGRESESIVFAPGYNTYDLARVYAREKLKQWPVRVHVVVGTKDFNHEANLDWMRHLGSLGIPFERTIVPDAPHSAKIVYDAVGVKVMNWHAANFRQAGLELVNRTR